MFVNIIGYYEHNNIGDDQYTLTISYLLIKLGICQSKEIRFLNSDKLDELLLNPKDVYIIGGGDVLTRYFFNNLKFLATPAFKNTKVIALSAGFPYFDYALIQQMEFVDYFFLRSQSDVYHLEPHFKNRVFYLQDASFLLPEIFNISVNSKKKGILICPTDYYINDNSIYGKENSKKLQDTIVKLINRISITNNEQVTIYPFGENDMLFCDRLIKSLKNKTNVRLVNTKKTIQETLELFRSYDRIIPMRFHSVLFCYMYQIQNYPIFSTPKIAKFLNDVNWQHYYHFNYNLSLTQEDLNNIISGLHHWKQTRSNNWKKYYDKKEPLQNLINCITSKEKPVCEKTLTVQWLKENMPRDLDAKTLAKWICFKITNKTITVYNWGLENKLKDLKNFNFEKEIGWLMQDYYSNPRNNQYICNENECGLFDLSFTDQVDYSGIHRFGWDRVYKKLQNYSNKNAELQLDLYLDKNFGWDYSINEKIGLIPYRKRWIGFIHHTFAKDQQNGIFEMFEKELFLESLQTCSGLFVLSRYLQRQLVWYLKKYDFVKIPVYFVQHPTDLSVQKFNLKKFKQTPRPVLLHVGSWLRNVYSFYELETRFKKCILKGSQDNIPSKVTVISDCKTEETCKPSNCSTTSNCSIDPSVNTLTNWEKQMNKRLRVIKNSVCELERVNDEQYDQLLSKSIIFINLIDASAVNTVLECIARNTPIVINKTEFTVEMLGNNYPLYYTYDNQSLQNATFNQQITKLLTFKNIKRANKYLCRMDKSKLTIDYFYKEFSSIVKDIIDGPLQKKKNGCKVKCCK